MTTAIDAPVRAPYKGLSPFDESDLDALLFFGRERETELVVANALAARLTVLYGPTGVGKSSLLRAGAVHALRRLSASEPIAVAYFSSWAGDPVTGIDETVRGGLADAFGGDPGDAPGDVADRIDGWTAALGAQLVLVLDQFEEHFLYHEHDGGVHDLLPELVTRPGLRVHVVLGIRDDELARLDVFKAQIPGLFSNYLRLDRLTREEGRAAILGPLERYNEHADDHVEIEPPLVETVLGEVALGRIEAGLAGRSGVADRTRIETPYLQLVMQRLWDVERERRSSVLRLATLVELGGAQQIVEDHLQRAMAALTPAQQAVAAGMFDHLVTPSGTKIAHGVADLASFAHVDVGQLQPVLSSLARERILRPTGERGTGGDRYEIYHDVLAGAVLGWKAQHEAEATLERERAAAHARQRRLAVVAAVSLAAFTLMAVLAAYAFSQRSTARHQAQVARIQQVNATRAQHAAQVSSHRAQRARQHEAALRRDATTQATRYRKLSRQYQVTAATAQSLTAKTAAQNDALTRQSNELAQKKTELADKNAQLTGAVGALTQSNGRLKGQTTRAERATHRAQQATVVARQQTAKAKAATSRAIAGAGLQRAQLELLNDPVQSVRDALKSARITTLPNTEAVLRSSLLAMHLLAVLPVGGPSNQIAYSPDGTRLAVASGAGELRLFSVPDGRRLQAIPTGSPLVAVGWSPDGRTIVGGSTTGAVWLWDAATGNVVQTFEQSPPLVSVGFSPDGRLLEAAGGHDVTLRDPATGLALQTLPHGDRHVRSAAFSDDGSLVLTTADQNIARVWDVASGNLVQPLQARSTINSAAFGPGGKLVVTGSQDGTGRIWDARTGAVVENLIGHSSAINAVAFSPLGDRVITGSTDGTVRVWSTTSGLVDVIRGFTSPVVDVAFAPDGQSAVGVEGNGREITFGVSQLQVSLVGESGAAHGAGFAPDGTTLATASGDNVQLWDPYGEPRLAGIHKHAAPASALAFDPSGKLLASADATGTVVIQKAHGGPLRTFDVSAPVLSLAWGANGTMLVAAKNGTLDVRAAGGAREVRTIPADPKTLVAAALRADGTVAATVGGDRTLRLWNVRSGAQLLAAPVPATVTSVALDPRGRFVAAGVGHDVAVYDAGSGKLVTTLHGHADVVTGLAFSPDGSLLASSSRDHDGRVWRTRGFVPVAVLHRHASAIAGVAFSGDGRWIATAGATKAGVWSPFASSELPGNFLFFARGNRDQLTAVAWSPRSWELATASRDGAIRVLDCRLCGRLPELEAYAKARLRSLGR